MLNHMRKLSVGLLMLILQMGFAHAVQHDLHDFNPTALTIEHDDSDCLLADTPQAKSALPALTHFYNKLPAMTFLPTLSRHDTTNPLKGPPARATHLSLISNFQLI